MSEKSIPIYLPSLLLSNAIAFAYIAASGFQYENWPFTLILVIIASLLLFVAFVLLILRNTWSGMFSLVAGILALPYFATSYFGLLLHILKGESRLIFTFGVMSFLLLLYIFTTSKCIQWSKSKMQINDLRRED